MKTKLQFIKSMHDHFLKFSKRTSQLPSKHHIHRSRHLECNTIQYNTVQIYRLLAYKKRPPKKVFKSRETFSKCYNFVSFFNHIRHCSKV